jgi:hypothetical protein
MDASEKRLAEAAIAMIVIAEALTRIIVDAMMSADAINGWEAAVIFRVLANEVRRAAEPLSADHFGRAIYEQAAMKFEGLAQARESSLRNPGR